MSLSHSFTPWIFYLSFEYLGGKFSHIIQMIRIISWRFHISLLLSQSKSWQVFEVILWLHKMSLMREFDCLVRILCITVTPWTPNSISCCKCIGGMNILDTFWWPILHRSYNKMFTEMHSLNNRRFSGNWR